MELFEEVLKTINLKSEMKIQMQYKIQEGNKWQSKKDSSPVDLEK